MIAYIDTRIGNLGSLLRAFERLGMALRPVAGEGDLDAAQAIVLPGVGAFGDGMASLRDQGLVEPLRRAAQRGGPIFGICLGMQLLFDTSEEHGSTEGLGLLPGAVRRLDPRGDTSCRVPNIGWCDVAPTRASRLFPAATPGTCYFVHSYVVAPDDPGIVTATIEFGGEAVPVAVERGDILGVQFHPEKSQDDGLAVLGGFLDDLRRSGRLAA